MQDSNGIGYTVGIVAIIVILLVASYFGSKFAASKYKRFAASKYMKILDQLYFAKDKAIVLMEIGDKNIVFGVTNQSISKLFEIDKEEIKPIEQETNFSMDIGKKFADFFKKRSSKVDDDVTYKSDTNFKSIFDSINNQNEKFQKYNIKDKDDDGEV